MSTRLLALALLGLALSCAHLKDDSTVCAEYRSQRCLNGEDCSLDRARGCKVCRCHPVSELGAADDKSTANAPPPR